MSVLLVVLFFGITVSYSQNIRITGTALDADNKEPLIQATIQLLDKDSVSRYHAISDNGGKFSLNNVENGKYIFKLSYIGYKTYYQNISSKEMGSLMDLGNLMIIPSDVQTPEVEINAQSAIGEQVGDTTQFNASSFKTTKDASTEDLIKKMPGMEVDPQGKVKAQGEEVKKVTVDGKPFFGDDPSLALKNLPAEVVDKVQVYDRGSDQSEFTGFDDGERSKSLNIVTKANRRQGQFGKFSAGYGYEEKYQANVNLNIFDGPQRISILGLSNNVNQQNFSVIDILDMMGSSRGRMLRRFASSGAMSALGSRMQYGIQRSGAGNFFVGQSEGISTSHAFGVNYSDYWSESLEISGSYFINYSDNNNDQLTNRDYLFSQDSTQYYNEDDLTDTKNINHRFNFKIDWDLDTNTSFRIRPSASIQSNNSASDALSNTQSISGISTNASNSNYYSDYTGYDLSNDLLFKHRFGIIGRTISVNLTTGLNNRDGSYNLFNQNVYNRDNTLYIDTVNQRSTTPQNGYNLRSNISYTEPIHENGQMMVSYEVSLNRNSFDQQTYNYNFITNDFDLLDSLTSNIFDNDYLYQSGGLAYRLKVDEVNITAGVDYQAASLLSKQYFPESDNLDYTFYIFLPSLRIQYRPNKQTNYYIRYRTNTDAPSVAQLQNVVNNSNPLQLSIGNPALTQQVSNSLYMRYNNFSDDFNNTFFGFLSLNQRMDYIGTSQVLARTDTIINGSLIVPAGAQVSMPVNLDGYWNAFTAINYGFPIGFISSKMNLNIGGSYIRTPGLINNELNYSNAYNYNFMFTLSSNISEDIDFNWTSRINFNHTINSIQKTNDLDYNNLINIANIKWIIWEGLFLQGDLKNQLNGGGYQPEDGNFTQVNLAIGKKILKNEAGEIKLYIYDVFNGSKSNQTNVTDFYTENVYNSVLEQYAMLTFTYNLSNFGFGK